MLSVSIITPTTRDREYFNAQCECLAHAQDYPNIIEHLFDYSDNTIGGKRNNLCNQTKGDVVVHMDSDDYYAPDWISKSVAALGDNDITGLRHGYFYNTLTKVGKYYTTSNPQPYVMGATMCYKKSMWERNRFNETVPYGEDSIFMGHAGKVKNHDYIDGFTALIHNKNTQSQMAFRTMRVVPSNQIPYVKG